jgi:hypothetical protein
MQIEDLNRETAPQPALFPLSPECVRHLLDAQKTQKNRVLPARLPFVDES